MADTFSNDLRLRLQESGSNAGTWGDLLNGTITNIASGFGQGSEAIPNASTHTITLADGTADEARSLYLKCTGGGQACTVTLGPNTISKVWIIDNATSYTLTFSQGSGANVAIAAGAVKVIATDGAGSGAAVVDTLDGLEGSLSTLAVTGEITANGGIALGDSDKATFGASDDLQIYHDGNHSYIEDAGTGSIKIKVGDFRVENASGNNLIKGVGDIATLHHAGSEKLATTSTGIDVTGNIIADGVGIGTSSASYALTVQKDVDDYIAKIENDGNSTSSNGLWVDTRWNTATNTVFKVTTNSGSSDVIVAKGDGNVGIGTGSPTATYRASIKGDYSSIIGGIEFDSGGGDKFTIGHASATSPSATLNVVGAGNLTFNTNNTERMRINAVGNIGIGTSSPYASSSWNRVLHVQSAGTGSSIRLADSVSGTSGEVGLMVGQYSNDAYFVNRDSGGVSIWANNTERLSITSVGAIFATGVRSSSAANSDLRYNTSNGELYYQTSSERYKSNIADLEFDTSNLYNLRPVSFDDNETGERCFGLIAEETFEQIPEAVVTRDIDGETVPDSIPYSMLSVIIINEMKKLKVENDSLKARLTALENN